MNIQISPASIHSQQLDDHTLKLQGIVCECLLKMYKSSNVKTCMCIIKSTFQILVNYNIVKKYFQDLLSQHFFFCQINLNNIFSSDNLLF